MKILCAVMGAIPHALNGMHQAYRDTWFQDFSGDARFFIGNGDYEPKPDEIRVNVPDTKDHILHKTVELLKWALERNYDLILKVDTDTYVNCSEMVKQNYAGFDYVGAPIGIVPDVFIGNIYSFLQGSATWLSPKAARIVIDEAISTMNGLLPGAMQYNGIICPYPHSEDLWVAQVLMPRVRSGELRMLPDKGYCDGPLTYHFASNKKHLMPDYMHNLHSNRSNPEMMSAIHRCRPV